LLIISVVAFAVGPALYRMADRARGSLAALDGFVMVTVAGLAMVHIIPHAVVTAGGGALAVTLAGFIGPGLVEHRLERAARQTHTAALVLALSGLAMHEFFDGVGLAKAFYDPSTGISLLAVAVVLHRLPIAITVWWLLRPLRGPRLAWSVLAALAGATVLGYALVGAVDGLVDARWLGLLEALIAGSLLHVVVHRPSPLTTPDQGARERRIAGFGALLGLVAVVALGSEHHIPLHGHESIGFNDIFSALVIESAPALLIAFALSGLVQVFLRRASLRWMRTGHSTTEAVRGVVFGLPLPICSCGVIPLYQTLVVQAVPATAAMAFLVATPELGIDSVLLSVPLLGAQFTVVRVAAATLVALIIGATLGRMAQLRRTRRMEDALAAAPEPRAPLLERARAGLRYGFGEVVDQTAPWIVLGIAIASLAEPALRSAWLTALPWGLDVLLFAVIGMPAYVCASGATPLVAVLLHKGVSPGAALAFLLTGPATNATTFGVLARLHGSRIALAFGAIMALLAVVLGLVVNLVLPDMGGMALYTEASSHATVFEMLAVAGFIAVVGLSVLRQGPRGFVGQVLSPIGSDTHDHGGDDDHGHRAGGDPCCDRAE
ncbi:MAG TPA: permease, partial [Kofleriaceae bacterium]|nr:permease [Kofleriaceae bacterium]